MVSPVDAGERAKQERRRQILAAAKAVFADAGYHGASIHAIIERAQIARGTFYLYFESKAAVFDSILDQALADLRARIHRIDVDDPGAQAPQVQLRTQVVATLEYIVKDRALATMLLSAGNTPDVEAAARIEQFYGEIRDLLRRALESGLEIGLLRKCHPGLVSAALLGLIRGVIEELVREDNELSVEQVVDELLMVALRGVLK
ncbi:MAG TPA: TetR/AcrR family transcriptional regulator [Kofleriaceae bacterium]|jgi:AcrR family transcriptional regulator|nr:TetR/AcrR family transcriptional regulator [Kofleriaceae bacterium]